VEAQLPDLTEETGLHAQGFRLIAGVDEVGRGALVGPVVAAAAILPQGARLPWFGLVRDSKELSPAARERLFDLIREQAQTGVGIVAAEIIDALGIVEATRRAMYQAVGQLSPSPDFVLIDYVTLPAIPTPQRAIVKGDRKCLSIACASIIAKVTRDRMMVELDRDYPGYYMGQHKGYGTKEHLRCLCQLGPSPIHRFSFRPVKELGWKNGT